MPPTIFGSVTEMISKHARAAAGFTRLMIEKPFGRDSQTFDALNALTSNHFDETQLFRLDHYLGKEVLLNTAPFPPGPGRGGCHRVRTAGDVTSVASSVTLA